MVYWSVEPPLADRIEFAIARLTALMAEINRNRKARPEPYAMAEFLPAWLKPAAPEQPAEEADGMAPERIMGVMEAFMTAQNVRVAARGKGSSSPSG